MRRHDATQRHLRLARNTDDAGVPSLNPSRPTHVRLPSLVLLLLLIHSLPVASAQSTTAGTLSCLAPLDPRGLGVHSSGALYVLDAEVGTIREYNIEDGQYSGELVAEGNVAGTEVAEGGLKVDGDFVFIAPGAGGGVSGGNTVVKIDASSAGGGGEIVLSFPSAAGGDDDITDEMFDGYDVAFDAHGEVYVSNFVDGGLNVYNGTTGEYLRTILEDLKVMGIAFGPDDILYASVPEDNTVQRFLRSQDNDNFTLIDAFINGGSGSRVREGPWGIAVNPLDYLIYVCWQDSNELTEYSQSGQELRWWEPGLEDSESDNGGVVRSTISSVNSAASGVALSPRFVAVDGEGDVYVSASGSGDADVFKYDGSSGNEVGRFSTCFGAGTSTTPSPFTPNPIKTATAAPETVSTVAPAIATPAPSSIATATPTVTPSPAETRASMSSTSQDQTIAPGTVVGTTVSPQTPAPSGSQRAVIGESETSGARGTGGGGSSSSSRFGTGLALGSMVVMMLFA